MLHNSATTKKQFPAFHCFSSFLIVYFIFIFVCFSNYCWDFRWASGLSILMYPSLYDKFLGRTVYLRHGCSKVCSVFLDCCQILTTVSNTLTPFLPSLCAFHVWVHLTCMLLHHESITIVSLCCRLHSPAHRLRRVHTHRSSQLVHPKPEHRCSGAEPEHHTPLPHVPRGVSTWHGGLGRLQSCHLSSRQIHIVPATPDERGCVRDPASPLHIIGSGHARVQRHH